MPDDRRRGLRSGGHCAARVVACRCFFGGLDHLRMDRSYQESATMPCWAGQAPVARRGDAGGGKVLARLEAIVKNKHLFREATETAGANWRT